jgi:hypothetical protein
VPHSNNGRFVVPFADFMQRKRVIQKKQVMKMG